MSTVLYIVRYKYFQLPNRLMNHCYAAICLLVLYLCTFANTVY